MARSPAEQIYDSLMMSARLPRAELYPYVNRTLAQLVDHAQRTVPFYRNRLDGVLGPDTAIDLEAWRHVKPLSRQDLQDNFEALTSSRIPESHGRADPRSTSGTTGKPVTVLVTERTRLMELALTGRFYSWIGIDPQKTFVILQGARHPLLRYRELIPDPWVPEWMAGENFGGYARMHYPVSAEDQLAYLAGLGPLYLNTQPSNFRRVLGAARDGLGPKPQICGIVSIGELVTEEDRLLARDICGCGIFNTYSATDVGTIAAQCSHGNLHVNAEVTRVEIVRSDGTPCEPGEEGRILLTTLSNGAMPLLRYDIGDIGVLGGLCKCGLSLPKLTLTIGRERQLFRFSDGGVAVPAFRMEKFADEFPVRQWQLVQVDSEAVELRFSSASSDENLAFAKIVDEIRAMFGRPLSVSFRRFEGEMTGSSGKLEPAMRAFA
jgi:phenylacetate-CoA ligase